MAVAVDLGSRSYSVHFGPLETSKLISSLELGKKSVVITDENVGPLYAERVLESLRSANIDVSQITIAAGEKSKSLAAAENILEAMAQAGLDRSSSVIALGGGVIGDLAGFVASVYFRGIPYVHIPTTVLAQVDSSIGGKTGVNLASGKNLVGSFHQPRAVLVDVSTLETLPEREFNEGCAEIIKHAIIRDADLFERLKTFDRTNIVELTAIIQRNIEIKADIVSKDETETLGLRALLNFGHTIGHGIENAAGYGAMLHGEAISLGMLAAARLSLANARLRQEDLAAIEAMLVQFGLPTKLPKTISTESILTAMGKDKKFSGGAIRFVLTSGIGDAFLSSHIGIEAIRREIEALR